MIANEIHAHYSMVTGFTLIHHTTTFHSVLISSFYPTHQSKGNPPPSQTTPNHSSTSPTEHSPHPTPIEYSPDSPYTPPPDS
mmetsp:Transcript_25220/g.50462  ORF Transcript_25220/g.50462 Transcript_25220/m.50462 type:complete len:82 (+) Transcript_25220:922-1167(+)